MTTEAVAELVARVAEGDYDAFHSLREAPDYLVPVLIDAFHSQIDGKLRADLVHVIWQHRLQSTIVFLASVLSDADSETWKQALDGLVAIGGDEAVAALKSALTSINPKDEKHSWFREALEQLGSTEVC